jgi:hypothetical protein
MLQKMDHLLACSQRFLLAKGNRLLTLSKDIIGIRCLLSIFSGPPIEAWAKLESGKIVSKGCIALLGLL